MSYGTLIRVIIAIGKTWQSEISEASFKANFSLAKTFAHYFVLNPHHKVNTLELANQAPGASGEPLSMCMNENVTISLTKICSKKYFTHNV